MLLGEPQRTQYDVNFTLFGFPVRVSVFFWIAGLLLGASWNAAGQMALLTWMLAMFLSILIHELGHTLAFRYFGISSHIVLYHMGGLAVPDSYGSTWQRSAHVNDPRHNLVISAAGPALQIAAAFLLALVVRGCGIRPPTDGIMFDFGGRPPGRSLEIFLVQFQIISIFWAFLNLLPVYPLDGGQIARNLFLLFGGANAIQYSLMLSVGAAVAVTLWTLNSQPFLGIMFAMLGYSSYQMLQSYGGGFQRRY